MQLNPTNTEAMKTLTRIITMTVLMVAGTWMLPQKASAQYPGIGYQDFYDQLAPYGAWVDDPNYGYVWIPDVAEGFMPYGTDGHWIYTEYGWTWVSDYDWGWATFHYGRWAYDSYYGWMWIPGREWGPAWVSWRRCNDYYGWAPLGPGITIEMTFRPGFFIPDDFWMFVRDRDFDRHEFGRYEYEHRNRHYLILNSQTIKNTYKDNQRDVTYVSGPDAREVGRITGKNITPVPIKENTKPGKTVVARDNITIYRPPVKTVEGNNVKPVPGRIVPRDNITPVKERKQGDLTKGRPVENQQNKEKVMPPAQQTNPPKYQREDNQNRNNNNTGVNTRNENERQSREIKHDNTVQPAPQQRVNQQNENRTRQQTNEQRNTNTNQNRQVQQRNNQQNNRTVKPKPSTTPHPAQGSKSEPEKK